MKFLAGTVQRSSIAIISGIIFPKLARRLPSFYTRQYKNKNKERMKEGYSRFKAFFLFSAPFPAVAAVLFTAFVETTAAGLSTACGGATFASARPRGAGGLCLSLFWLASLAPAFSLPLSSTLEGESWRGPEDDRGLVGVEEVVDGVTKVVTAC